MKTKFTIFILLFTLFLAQSAAQTDPSVKTDHYKTKTFDCVIFPENYDGLGLGESKRFTPSRADIELAENALVKNLAMLNKEEINQGKDYGPVIHKSLKKYKRQYFGFIDEKGNRVLFINCFWAEEYLLDFWQKKLIEVFDGGSYYWSVKYSLNTGKLYQLMVNGVS